MEKERKKAPFVFSWADEVEKAEEEEEKEKEKTNPFGSARPREVVLCKKGVDWRKLDRERERRSNLRNEERANENIHKKPKQNARDVLHGSVAAYYCVQPEGAKQNASPLVPPIKYPPKNINPLLEQIRSCGNAKLDLRCVNSYEYRYTCEFNGASYNQNVGYELQKRKLIADRFICGARENIVRSGRRQILVDFNVNRSTNWNTYMDKKGLLRTPMEPHLYYSWHSHQDYNNVRGYSNHSRRAVASMEGERGEHPGDNYKNKRGMDSAPMGGASQKRREGKHARR